MKAISQAVNRVAVERCAVFPALSEDGFDVADRRAPDRQLRVVPRWPLAVHLRHWLSLFIPAMSRVVRAAVAQVDAANEGNIHPWPSGMPEHNELLVMGAPGPHSHVAQDFASSGVDFLTKMAVL